MPRIRCLNSAKGLFETIRQRSCFFPSFNCYSLGLALLTNLETSQEPLKVAFKSILSLNPPDLIHHFLGFLNALIPCLLIIHLFHLLQAPSGLFNLWVIQFQDFVLHMFTVAPEYNIACSSDIVHLQEFSQSLQNPVLVVQFASVRNVLVKHSKKDCK